jgi:hypothetical protein
MKEFGMSRLERLGLDLRLSKHHITAGSVILPFNSAEGKLIKLNCSVKKLYSKVSTFENFGETVTGSGSLWCGGRPLGGPLNRPSLPVQETEETSRHPEYL